MSRQAIVAVTGVKVFLHEYGAVHRADIWVVPGYKGAMFQINNIPSGLDQDVFADFEVKRYAAWMSRGAQHGTMLVADEDLVINLSGDLGQLLIEAKERVGDAL